MNNEEIEDGNRLIALFMGYKESESGYYPEVPDEYDYKGRVISVGPYQGDKPLNIFHQSWDWLKPVINKIGNLIETGEYYHHRIMNMTIFSSIEDIWDACVQFIKYYNEKKS